MRMKKRPQTSNPCHPPPPPSPSPRLPVSILEPYSDFPTPEQCKAVRDDLLAADGFPSQFADHKKKRAKRNRTQAIQSADDDDGEEGEECAQRSDTVLDGVVSTLLSQNTTETNSARAFVSLKSAFPNWENVLGAENETLENAIRCGGLAKTKAAWIKRILKELMERRGDFSLEYLRELPVDEVKAELSRFKGIGPKTVACVLMFNLQQDDFPVDTHVLRITKSMGWVPVKADREKAYLHLNRRIPDELKFDLNCLLFTHGKLCQSCSKKGGNQLTGISRTPCPLTKYRVGTEQQSPPLD